MNWLFVLFAPEPLYNGIGRNLFVPIPYINYNIETKGIIKEILPLNKYSFIISINNNNSNSELCLSKLKKSYNKYNFIYGFKIEGKSFKNIDFCKKGSIFYLNNDNLFVLTLNLQNLKINYANWHLNSKPDLRFKVMFLGDSGSGKSSIIRKVIYNEFIENHYIDISSNLFVLRMEINNYIIDLYLLDTPGRETSIDNIEYQQGTVLVIATYSINSTKSFNIVNMWIKKIKEFYLKCPLIYLIGNKVDLETQREVWKKEGALLTCKNNLNLFMEVSAKTGQNIKNIFIQAAKQLIRKKIFSSLMDWIEKIILIDNI